MREPSTFTAIVLAGSRSGVDPLVEVIGAQYKALITIDGVAMIERVVDTLKASTSIGHIVLVFQDDVTLRQECPGIFSSYGPGVSIAQCQQSPCTSAIDAIEDGALAAGWPFLLTTADHPLLTPLMVDEFCNAASRQDGCFAVGLIEKHIFAPKYPNNVRTFLPLKGTQITGCNMFALMTEQAVTVLKFWKCIEEKRKKPWHIFKAFGFISLAALVLRQLTVERAFARGSQIIGAKVTPVCLSYPEAAIDVDKITDLHQASEIIDQRKAALA